LPSVVVLPEPLTRVENALARDQLGGDGGCQRLPDLALVRLAAEALLAERGGDLRGGLGA